MNTRDLRIGDVERDDAARLLQEHLTAGRLDHDEFGARMERALRATHRSELDGLFDDLPGRRPGAVEAAHAPLPVAAPTRQRPWLPWAFGGLAVGALGAGSMVMHALWEPPMHEMGRHAGRHGHDVAMHPHFPVMPLLMLLLVAGTVAWILLRRATDPHRQVAGHRRQAPATAPALTADQRAEIDAALRSGHRVRAIRLFREATGVPLSEAVAAISAWQRRARASRA